MRDSTLNNLMLTMGVECPSFVPILEELATVRILLREVHAIADGMILTHGAPNDEAVMHMMAASSTIQSWGG